MSKKKSSKSSTPAVPAPPPPQNENYYENGFLRSSNIYDKASNTYNTNNYSTEAEQGIEKQATDYIGNMVNTLPGKMDLSPENIQQYKDAYSAPQIAALNQSYNEASGRANQMATKNGMRNSVGFGNYTANQLEKNRAQGLADIQANATMQGYDLPNKILSPYVNQFNLINAALNGEQASMNQDLQPAIQGSAMANNASSQNFANQMMAYNAQMAAKQQQQRGGLFSMFTGGY